MFLFKRNMMIAYMLLTALYLTDPKQLHALKTQKIDTIICDLGDVLFTTQKPSFFSFLNVIRQYPSLIRFLLTTDIQEAYFKLLEQVPAQPKTKVFYNNKLCPDIMSEWMTSQSSKQIQDRVITTIKNSGHPEKIKALFSIITKFVFDPEIIAQAQKVNHELLNKLITLKQAGIKLYIISNWSGDGFDELYLLHPDVFKHFDGIIVSGHENTAKPDREIFKLLESRYNVNLKTSLFIDDEIHNCYTARSLGIETIKHHNNSTTVEKLKKILTT